MRAEKRQRQTEPIEMPKVPDVFINHDKVRHVLCHTIEGFGFEEQKAIYLYCFLGLSVNEIAILTKMSTDYVTSVLTLYSERLGFKLDVFKKAIPYNVSDVQPVSEILALEFQAI